jgi:putative transposase
LRGPVESAQFTSIRYSERLAEIGAVPSIGTVGDSYDCEIKGAAGVGLTLAYD